MIREDLQHLEERGVHVIENPCNGISAIGLDECEEQILDYFCNMRRSSDEAIRAQYERLIATMGAECCASCASSRAIRDLGNEWVTRQGTWPKRLAKMIKTESAVVVNGKRVSGHKMSSGPLAAIGKTARDHCGMFNSVWAQLTRILEWERGLFGRDEHGSCFWSCHAGARDVLTEQGAYAFQLFEDADCRHGLARCWVAIPSNIETFCVAFNCYSQERSEITLLTLARLLALDLGLSYYKLNMLRNNGYWDGLVYINGGKGFSVGPYDAIDGENSVDLKYEIKREEGYCYECEGHFLIHQMVLGPDARSYCQDCFDEYFATCMCCDNHFDREDMTYVGAYEDEPVCEGCIDRYFRFCDSCERYYDADYVSFHTVTNKRGYESVFCTNCLEHEHVFECENCGAYFMSDALIQRGGFEYCEECATELEEADLEKEETEAA